MRHLGMELDSVAAALRILECTDRRVDRFRSQREARRQLDDTVAVAFPHLLPLWRSGEERRVRDHFDLRAPVLALTRCLHLAVEKVRGELHPVADAEDGDAEVEDFAGSDR